jgi:site-specific recombinase XerD
VPTVLTTEAALQLMGSVSGTPELMAQGLYGTGRRRMECLWLRVTDLDGAPQQIVVRDGNGLEDRVTMRPARLVGPLQEHGARVQRVHAPDVAHGFGAVYLPFALEPKSPRASRLWIWQYVFPSDRLSKDPHTGIIRRHHTSESGLQKTVSQASRAVGLNKHISGQTFRHSFATHLLQQGYAIRTVQKLLGHKNVKTTMMYTPVLTRGRLAVRSPLDERGRPWYVPAFFEP